MYVNTRCAGDGGRADGPRDERAPASWLSLLPAPQLYPAGTVLVQQGCEPYEIFFVEDGLAKLVRIDAGGREQILGLRGAGWFLGAAFVLIRRSHAASAVALTSCTVRRLSQDAFLALLAEHPDLSWHVHRMHSREVLSQFHHMSDLGAKTSRQRLERILRRLATLSSPDGSGEEVRLLLPLKRWELASLIAVTPEHLSRLLKRLREEGIIRVQRGWIVIPEVRRLAADGAQEFGVLTTTVSTGAPEAVAASVC